MSQYKKRTHAASVLALCFTEARETYHHWQVFAPGSDGVCIEFEKSKFLDEIAHDPSIRARNVMYKQLSEIAGSPITDDDLPYLKRRPYQDEHEFRLLYVHADLTKVIHEVEIELDAISRITLSPWMPEALAEAVKETLKEIDGCGHLKIYRSTLIENERWMNAADET